MTPADAKRALGCIDEGLAQFMGVLVIGLLLTSVLPHRGAQRRPRNRAAEIRRECERVRQLARTYGR